jgi:thiol-disulfide isomerase/thioredoxin
MRIYLCILSMLCLLANATAQKTYRPGDTVTNLRQYVPNPKKLVIFDFWSLSCSSCIGQFPKLDSLQHVFNNDIDIVLVNEDKLADSNKVNKYVRQTSLQSISGDSKFVKSFPHLAVPHYVWVNEAGKIVGQTHAWDVTGPNLRAVLSGEKEIFVTKAEIYRYHVRRDSLGSGLYRSILTGAQLHLSGGQGSLVDLEWRLSKVSAINESLQSLVKRAYRYERKKPKNIPNNDNLYCYELVIPPTPHKEAYRYMQADLERYFGIKRPKYGLFSRRKFLKNPK